MRDLDKDGWITRNDFKLVIQRYKELGASQEHLDKLSSLLLGSLDKMGLTDDSKNFSYQEFEEMWAKIPITDAAGMQMFRIIDSNNDGKISFKEWQDYYTCVDIDLKYARASFDAMDTDHDGIVSQEEFKASFHEYFYSTEDKLQSSLMYGKE